MLNKLSWQHEFNCNEGDTVIFNKIGREEFGSHVRYIIKKIIIPHKEFPVGLVMLKSLEKESFKLRLSYPQAIDYLEKIS